MSKILRNDTSADAVLNDVGVTVAALSSYTIPPQNYSVFAASSDVIRFLADGTLVLNDGSNDILNLSEAVDIIKGWFPKGQDDAVIGETVQFAGVVFDSQEDIPSPPGSVISTVLIRCPKQLPNTKVLKYSFDGGVTFHELAPGEFVGWSLRGSKSQVSLIGDSSGVNYEVTMNRIT